MSRGAVIGIGVAVVVILAAGIAIMSRQEKTPPPAATAGKETRTPEKDSQTTAKEPRTTAPESTGQKAPVPIAKEAPKWVDPVEKVVREWTLPEGAASGDMYFSPSGEFVACAWGEPKRLSFNDRRTGPYESILFHYLSPDGRHVAFAARSNGKEMMVIDGVEGKAWDKLGVPVSPTSPGNWFPPKGADPAYAAQDASSGDWRVIRGAVEGPAFDRIIKIFYSDDGKHLAYAAVRGGRMLFVVDGKETPAFDPPDYNGATAAFSPDGARFAYVGQHGRSRFVSCDGKESAAFENVWNITFSPDGRRMAFLGRPAARRYCLVIDGTEGPRADMIDEFSFSPDSKHVAWCAQDSGRWKLIVDGKEQAANARGGRYLPDGSLYWTEIDGDQCTHVWNGRRFPAGTWSADQYPWDVYPRPNGRHFAYWFRAGTNKRCLMLDGKPCVYAAEAQARWSEDGEHLLYRLPYVGAGSEFAGCDDRFATVGYPQGFAAFSPDGRHAAYASRDRLGAFACCDGFRLPRHERVHELTAGDKLRYTAVDSTAGKAQFIEVAWPEAGTWKDAFPKEGEARAFTQAPIAPPPAPAGETLAEKVVREWRVPEMRQPAHFAYGMSEAFIAGTLPGAKDSLIFNDKRLGGYDELIGPGVTSRQARAAWLAKRDGKQMVVVDGVEGKPHKTVKPLSRWASLLGPDGRSVIYAARDEGEKGWHLCWDDREFVSVDRLVEVVFSADGRHMAYAAMRGKDTTFVCDGKEIPGQAVCFPPSLPSGKTEDSLPEMYTRYNPTDAAFSPDGSRFACVIRHVTPASPDDKKGAGRYAPQMLSVLCDGKEGPPFERIEKLCFSPDGRRMAYVAGDAVRRFAVVDGVAQSEDDGALDLCFSPDSAHVAWIGGPGRLFLDGKDTQRTVETFWFAADGSLAWTIRGNEVRGYYVNGRQLPRYSDLSARAQFSADRKHMAFIGGSGDAKKCLVRDGVPGPGFAAINPAFRWSPDGQHVLYMTQRGPKQSYELWCDDRPAPADAWAWYSCFSPDSFHAAYTVSTHDGVCVSCDGLRGPWHDSVLPLVASDKLRYIALDEDRMLARLIEVDWPSGRTWKDAFGAPVKEQPWRRMIFPAAMSILCLATLCLAAMGAPAADTKPKMTLAAMDEAKAKEWMEQWEKNITGDARNRYCDKEMGEEIGWLMTPFLDGFYYGYMATQDTKWIDRIVDWTDSWVKRGVKEPDGFVGWPKLQAAGTDVDKLNQFNADSLLGEAMVLRAITLMSAEILKTPALKEKYGAKADAYLKLSEQVYEKWDKRGAWRETKGGGTITVVMPFGIDEKTGKWTPGYETRNAPGSGFSHPNNKANECARWLLALYDATKKPAYRDRAERWFRLMASRMHLKPDGATYVIWNYWEPAGPWDFKPGGKNTKHWVGVHPKGGYYELDTQGIVDAWEHGLVFTKADVDKLIATALAEKRYWSALAPYNPEIQKQFESSLKPDKWGGLAATPWYLWLQSQLHPRAP